MTSAPRKRIEGAELTGGMLCSVISNIVASLNGSMAVSIPDMWSSIVARIAESEARKVSVRVCPRAGCFTAQCFMTPIMPRCLSSMEGV